MDAVGDIFSGLIQVYCLMIELLVEGAVLLLQLLFFVVEKIVCGVLSLGGCSEIVGPRRKRELPEETLWWIRSCLHTTLALGLVGLVVYFGWLREPATKAPASPPAAPTKIEKAQNLIEKAKRIKEVLSPPKTQP